MENIGKLIQEKRLESGMSLRELGAKCGISDAAISRIEKGKTPNPEWTNLCKISKALNINTLQILLAAGFINEDELCSDTKLHGLDDLSADEISNIQAYIDFLHFKRNEGDHL